MYLDPDPPEKRWYRRYVSDRDLTSADVDRLQTTLFGSNGPLDKVQTIRLILASVGILLHVRRTDEDDKCNPESADRSSGGETTMIGLHSISEGRGVSHCSAMPHGSHGNSRISMTIRTMTKKTKTGMSGRGPKENLSCLREDTTTIDSAIPSTGNCHGYEIVHPGS